MLTDLWGLYGAKFHTTAHSAASTLGGIMKQGVGVQTNVVKDPTSGEFYPRWVSITGQQYRPSLSTKAIEAALGLVGMSGLTIAADGSHPGLVLYGQKQADGSSRGSGSVHRSFTIKKGVIIPTQISIDHQGDAELDLLALPTWDGTNNPVIISDTAALPTAPTDDERFTLGPITLGGVSFTGFDKLTIEFGITAKTFGAESLIWDSYARLETAMPRITLTGKHVTWYGSGFVTDTGLACTHANSKLFLKARANESSFYADNTSNHYKFTFCGLATVTDGFSANGEEPAEVSLAIDCAYDGSTIPLYGAANQAIA